MFFFCLFEFVRPISPVEGDRFQGSPCLPSNETWELNQIGSMYMNSCPPLWEALPTTSWVSVLISRAVCKTAQIGGVCSRMVAESSIKEALSG